MDTQQLRQQINDLLMGYEYDSIKQLLLSYKDITEHDNDLAMVCYLCTIYEHEKAAGQFTLFSKIADVDELLERYTVLKFYLRRIDFDVMDEMETFYQFLIQNQVSSYELLGVMDFSIVNRDKVLKTIDRGGTIAFSDGRDGGADKENGYDRYAGESGNDEHEPEGVLFDDNEMCFIICTNNQIYAQECVYYIEHLRVPDGIHISILTVEDAESLSSAYNEAMQCSQAKYKVYLHHDTFIINRNFINDCLHIFRDNPQVGMIGNVGVKRMPASGVMWDADRYGMLYEQHIYETKLLANAIGPDLDYLEADAIDGFIMITQYDIPWREDLFTGWDFYDCSQSMEFKRRGYKVAVPNMQEPWCVHDCGFINLQNYDTERRKFISEYLSD